jgi:membrane protein DedA with SNARE-associated domain
MIRRKVSRQLAVIGLTLAVPIIPFVIIGEVPGDKWLSAIDENAWLFGISGSGLLTLDILLPIPSSIVGTFLGARLGFWSGFAFTWCGLVAGNLAGFSMARFVSVQFRSWLPPFPETTTQAIVFLSRPVPILAEAVALAAGTTQMSLQQFFFLSAAGNAIYASVLCGNGATLLPDDLMGPGLIIPMALPVIAWLTWQALRKRRSTTP